MPARRFLVGQQQLVGDPDQHRPAGEEQPRDLEEPDHGERHHRAHDDRAHGAQGDGALAQVLGHVARGERDHDGVVAGEHEVDDDDGAQRVEELQREDLHGSILRRAGPGRHRKSRCRDRDSR
jgi:hypothetical protein